MTLTPCGDSKKLPLMYKIVGADQKEYGPVAAQQIQEWIAQGRANGQTLGRLDEGPWKPLSSFPEFTVALSNAPVSASPPIAPIAAVLSSEAKTNPLATAGLVLSIFGFFQCCTPFIAFLGLIFSSIALYQIKIDPDRYAGRSLALAGIIVSVIGIIIFWILLSTGMIDELMKSLPKVEVP